MATSHPSDLVSWYPAGTDLMTIELSHGLEVERCLTVVPGMDASFRAQICVVSRPSLVSLQTALSVRSLGAVPVDRPFRQTAPSGQDRPGTCETLPADTHNPWKDPSPDNVRGWNHIAVSAGPSAVPFWQSACGQVFRNGIGYCDADSLGRGVGPSRLHRR